MPLNIPILTAAIDELLGHATETMGIVTALNKFLARRAEAPKATKTKPRRARITARRVTPKAVPVTSKPVTTGRSAKHLSGDDVYRVIASHSGLTLGELAQAIGRSEATARFHTKHLAAEGRITRGKDDKWRRTVAAVQTEH